MVFKGEILSAVRKRTKKMRFRKRKGKGNQAVLSDSSEGSTCSTTTTCYGDGILTHEEEEVVASILENNRRVAAQSFANVYRLTPESHQVAGEGTIVTSLVGDIWYVVEIHLKVLDDLLQMQRKSKQRRQYSFSKEQQEAIVLDGILSIFRPLFLEQTRYCRTKVFNETTASLTLQEYCAAANDFMCMANQMEDLVERLQEKYPFLAESDYETSVVGSPFSSASCVASFRDGEEVEMLAMLQLFERESNELISCFTRDAVLAAQQVHVGCMERAVLHSPMAQKLFGFDWEDRFDSNEICTDLLDSLQELIEQVELFLSQDFLFEKFMQALCKAMVGTYLQRLARKANNHCNVLLPLARKHYDHRPPHQHNALIHIDNDVSLQETKQPQLQGDELPPLAPFHAAIPLPIKHPEGIPRNHKYNRFVNSKVALGRIRHDIRILSEFFLGFAKGRPTHFCKILKDELSLLTLAHEYLTIVTDYDRQKTHLLEDFVLMFHKQSKLEFQLTRYFLTDLFHLMKPREFGRKKLTKLWKAMEPQLRVISELQNTTAKNQEYRLERKGFHDDLPVVSSCSWEAPLQLSVQSMLSDFYEERLSQEICGNSLQLCLQLLDLQKHQEMQLCNPIDLWRR